MELDHPIPPHYYMAILGLFLLLLESSTNPRLVDDGPVSKPGIVQLLVYAASKVAIHIVHLFENILLVGIRMRMLQRPQ